MGDAEVILNPSFAEPRGSASKCFLKRLFDYFKAPDCHSRAKSELVRNCEDYDKRTTKNIDVSLVLKVMVESEERGWNSMTDGYTTDYDDPVKHVNDGLNWLFDEAKGKNAKNVLLFGHSMYFRDFILAEGSPYEMSDPNEDKSSCYPSDGRKKYRNTAAVFFRL